MDPPEDNWTRHVATKFVVALAVTASLLVLAVFIPNKTVHFVSVVLAFAFGLPIALLFYVRLVGSSDRRSEKLPTFSQRIVRQGYPEEEGYR